MKKIQFFLSLTVLLGFFASCTTDVELYADYKDIPVVYGLLDATKDTNFMRINRAFSPPALPMWSFMPTTRTFL